MVECEVAIRGRAQWHPEYDMETDAVSRRILLSFGDAVSVSCARQKSFLRYGT